MVELTGEISALLRDWQWPGLIAKYAFEIAFVSVVIYAIATKGRREETAAREKPARIAYARERMWCYDDSPDPAAPNVRYRFFGTTPGGLKWKLEYDSDASSTGSQPRFRWHCSPPPGKRFEYIMLTNAGRYKVGKDYDDNPPGNLFLRAFVSGAHAALGSDYMAAQTAFLKSASEVPTGNAKFHAAFQALVSGQIDGSRIFTPAVARQLVEWPGLAAAPKYSVSLEVSGDGALLVLAVRQDAFSQALCEQMVNVGGVIADSLAAAYSISHGTSTP